MTFVTIYHRPSQSEVIVQVTESEGRVYFPAGEVFKVEEVRGIGGEKSLDMITRSEFNEFTTKQRIAYAKGPFHDKHPLQNVYG